MKIQLSDNIRETVRKKDLGGLVVTTKKSCSCCGSFENMNTQLVSRARMDELKKEDYTAHDAEGVTVLFSNRLNVGDEVSIKMLSLPGIKTFSVSGIEPVITACRPS